MGCSTSTQTQTQEDNRPVAKLNESNGPNKCVSTDENPGADENETIPDQSQLTQMKEDIVSPEETLSNDSPPSEDEGALEILSDCIIPTSEEVATKEMASSLAEVDEEEESPPPSEDVAEKQDSEEDLLIEGETGEKVEGETHTEAAVSEDPETKEDETGEVVDAAVTEIAEASNEE